MLVVLFVILDLCSIDAHLYSIDSPNQFTVKAKHFPLLQFVMDILGIIVNVANRVRQVDQKVEIGTYIKFDPIIPTIIWYGNSTIMLFCYENTSNPKYLDMVHLFYL